MTEMYIYRRLPTRYRPALPIGAILFALLVLATTYCILTPIGSGASSSTVRHRVGAVTVAEAATVRKVASGSHDLRGKPSITVATIERVLQQYHSPAIGNGQAFYDLGVKYGVDPVWMVAWFAHESAAGTTGAAVATKSVGNLICSGWLGNCIGRFRAYDSYAQAAEDWYQLITGPLYFGAGLYTPEAITPRYAPDSDNNDSAGYAKAVEQMVDEWRGWLWMYYC